MIYILILIDKKIFFNILLHKKIPNSCRFCFELDDRSYWFGQIFYQSFQLFQCFTLLIQEIIFLIMSGLNTTHAVGQQMRQNIKGYPVWFRSQTGFNGCPDGPGGEFAVFQLSGFIHFCTDIFDLVSQVTGTNRIYAPIT